jgi:hypothetical protein
VFGLPHEEGMVSSYFIQQFYCRLACAVSDYVLIVIGEVGKALLYQSAPQTTREKGSFFFPQINSVLSLNVVPQLLELFFCYGNHFESLLPKRGSIEMGGLRPPILLVAES